MATSPSASLCRIVVLLTGVSPSIRMSTTFTENPISSPSEASSLTSPLRLCPIAKSGPTTKPRMCSVSCNLNIKSLTLRRDNSMSNVIGQTKSTPNLPIIRNRSSRVLMYLGAIFGRRIERG